MEVAGLDLAGSEKNPTGYCLLTEEEGKKEVSTTLLYGDDEILERLKEDGPQIVAIDGPVTYDGGERECDRLLAQYGALPVTLSGMRCLAERANALAKKITSCQVIEVHAKACGKVLGVYEKKDFDFQKSIMALELGGDLATKILTRDELDAIVCAITGYLHLEGQTKNVGDGEAQIVIPSV